MPIPRENPNPPCPGGTDVWLNELHGPKPLPVFEPWPCGPVPSFLGISLTSFFEFAKGIVLTMPFGL